MFTLGDLYVFFFDWLWLEGIEIDATSDLIIESLCLACIGFVFYLVLCCFKRFLKFLFP